MRWQAALLGLFVGTTTASCAFLLDFEELQKEEPTGPKIDLADAPAAYAGALCARFERCLGPIMPLFFADEDCKELLTLQLHDSVFEGLGGLPPSGFAYNPDLAQACIDAVRDAECDTSFTFPEACEAAIEGRVELGGTCTHPAECKRGLYCQITGACPGTCQPRPPAGQPCAQGTCLEGLECDATFGCVEPVSVGGECGGTTKPDCKLGLFCLGATKDKSGQCKPVAEVFQADSGYVCNWQQGSLCKAGLSCEINSTDEVLSGSFNGKCVPDIAPGGQCRFGIPDPCTPNHYCKPANDQTVDGVCTELPGLGGECAKDGVAGAPCKAKFRCVAAAVDGSVVETCQALVSLGFGCSENEACYSGNCSNDLCAPPNYCKLTD